MKDLKHGGNVWEAGRKLHCRFDQVLDFSSNINPLGPPKGAREAFLNGLKKITYYPDPEYISLRKGLARFLGVDYTSIFVGNGLSQIIDLVSRSFDFRRACIVGPTYGEYEMALSKSGVPVTHFILKEKNNFELDEKKLYETLYSKKESAIFICNPNNPTGSLIPKEFFGKLLKMISSRRHWLIVDEAFIDFTSSGRKNSLISLIDSYPRLIILWSLTKIFSFPGLRLGVAVANKKKIIDRLKEISPPWSVNILAEEIAQVSLRDRAFLKDTRHEILIERRYLLQRLEEFDNLNVYPSQANFFLIRILNRSISVRELAKKLLTHKILIRDCSNFRSLDRYFFRIAVKDRASNKRLISALSKYLN